MPSVRIRRSGADYAELSEGTQRSTEGRARGQSTLASLFQRTRPDSPAAPAEEVLGRPRATTSATQKHEERPTSVVHQYCTQGQTRARQNTRLSEVHSPVDRAKSQSPVRPGSVVTHGREVDLVLEPTDMRGAVGSALSFHTAENLPPGSALTEPEGGVHHHDDVVEHLSVIDNHISTVSNLSNVSNSIIIPNLPIYNRRPIVTLPTLAEDDGDSEKGKKAGRDSLDRHVEDVLTNRRKIRRALSGFWGFITTPMGFVSFVYGFLCAFWGAAIVIFLLKIINLHNKDRQDFWVEISSQIENALFTVTGVGLIPWRVIDTYRIAKIWHYRQVTRRLRRNAQLPALIDGDDLPDPIYNPNYVHVLSETQQADLHYQQQKFMASQTWYRPHETDTHKAFPIKTALFICLYVDFNSVFQCMLCGCMWGLNRFQRPAWTTGSLIPASFLCGIAAGVLIWRGGNQTKKVKEVEERLREALDMESQGVGIAGYTGPQPTGEEFAVVTGPGEASGPISPGLAGPSSPGATSPGAVGSAMNAVPKPIGQSANLDPAVVVPAAPQPVVSGLAPHPGLVDNLTQMRSQSEDDGERKSENGTIARSEDGTMDQSEDCKLGQSEASLGARSRTAPDPETPMAGVDKLPLLKDERR